MKAHELAKRLLGGPDLEVNISTLVLLGLLMGVGWRSEMIVHILSGGRALCGREGTPNQWPDGHVWMSATDARDSETNRKLMPMDGNPCTACWARLDTKGKTQGKT